MNDAHCAGANRLQNKTNKLLRTHCHLHVVAEQFDVDGRAEMRRLEEKVEVKEKHTDENWEWFHRRARFRAGEITETAAAEAHKRDGVSPRA